MLREGALICDQERVVNSRTESTHPYAYEVGIARREGSFVSL